MYELAEAVAVVGGRDAGHILAQKSTLEQILQRLPGLERRQDVNNR